LWYFVFCSLFDYLQCVSFILQICDDRDIDLSVAVSERKPAADLNVGTQAVK